MTNLKFKDAYSEFFGRKNMIVIGPGERPSLIIEPDGTTYFQGIKISKDPVLRDLLYDALNEYKK